MDGINPMLTSLRRRFIALLVMMLLAHDAFADSAEELRVVVASRLFPSLLAADLQLEQKRSDDKRLLILVVYLEEHVTAERAAAEIARVRQIRKHQLDVRIVSAVDLAGYGSRAIAGIFIGDKLDDQLVSVLAFAQQRSVITFSPYPGDVEMGVVGGIQVRDRILPYINLKAVRDSALSLRPFYLKVAETYEPE